MKDENKDANKPEENSINTSETNDKQASNNGSVSTIFLVAGISAILGAAASWFVLTYNITINKDLVNSSSTKTSLSQKDTTIKNQESTGIKITPTTKQESAIDQITTLFMTKYDKSKEETTITISKSTLNHIQGGVKFEGEIGGGMFFAYKDDSGEWTLIYDGHGTIPCDDIEPYSFPVDMIPECIDNNGQLVIR